MKKLICGYAIVFVMGTISLTIIFFLFGCVARHPTGHPTLSPTSITLTSAPSNTPRLVSTTRVPTILPTHSSTSTSTTTPTIPFTSTPDLTSLPSPTALPLCQAVKPIATASIMWGASASPDGQWVSYWAPSQEAIAQAGGEYPTLIAHFINIQTGKACIHPEITTDSYWPQLGWSVNDQVTITTTKGAYTGLPCQPESFNMASQQVAKVIGASPTPYPTFSPDRKYQIKTVALANENDIFNFDTSIVYIDSGKMVQSVTWHIDAREGSYQDYTGGEWISPSQFLIYETIDRGPLILDADKGVIQVLTDLLSTQIPVSPLNGGSFTVRAIPLPASKRDQYHLLVVGGSGYTSDFPNAILYHAENGIVETLPYKTPWYGGFSPDHYWVMMDKEPDVQGHGAHEVWIRPLEDIHADWQLLGGPEEIEYGALWNATYTEMVINHEDRITWQPFPNPNHVRLGCWSTYGYWTNLEMLSQDGCFVLTTGNWPGESDYGLFILDRCHAIPTPPPVPTQTKEFLTLAEAQAVAKFTLLSPSYMPDGLLFKKVTIMDYPDGSQAVLITYAEDYTGESPNANQKMVFFRVAIGTEPVTLDSITSVFKEKAMDIRNVTVRGQAGFTYWEPSVAGGNSAWLAWNERDITITIALYGDWPQPTEDNPHALDDLLIRIADSLR